MRKGVTQGLGEDLPDIILLDMHGFLVSLPVQQVKVLCWCFLLGRRLVSLDRLRSLLGFLLSLALLAGGTGLFGILVVLICTVLNLAI